MRRQGLDAKPTKRQNGAFAVKPAMPALHVLSGQLMHCANDDIGDHAQCTAKIGWVQNMAERLNLALEPPFPCPPLYRVKRFLNGQVGDCGLQLPFPNIGAGEWVEELVKQDKVTPGWGAAQLGRHPR